MCLRDMLCNSLGGIKFDIELVVLSYFENMVLVILEWLARYLGLPLITIVACDMLCFAYSEEVINHFEFYMHFLLSVLSSVCLRTNNGLSMGEFDKCLKCISF